MREKYESLALTDLKELAKEYCKLYGRKHPIEVILVGGASILINYGFRQMTTDIDAVIGTRLSIKKAINNIGDKFGLPNGWLNTDFVCTTSYSPILVEVSKFYKCYYKVFSVRTVAGEYLIAMKLKAGRKYKNDLSDIIGILAEHDKRGNAIYFDQVCEAVKKLYGSWNSISEDSKLFIENAIKNGNYKQYYQNVRNEETETKEKLIGFQEKYPESIKPSNVNEIINLLKKKERK